MNTRRASLSIIAGGLLVAAGAALLGGTGGVAAPAEVPGGSAANALSGPARASVVARSSPHERSVVRVPQVESPSPDSSAPLALDRLHSTPRMQREDLLELVADALSRREFVSALTRSAGRVHAQMHPQMATPFTVKMAETAYDVLLSGLVRAREETPDPRYRDRRPQADGPVTVEHTYLLAAIPSLPEALLGGGVAVSARLRAQPSLAGDAVVAYQTSKSLAERVTRMECVIARGEWELSLVFGEDFCRAHRWGAGLQ